MPYIPTAQLTQIAAGTGLVLEGNVLSVVDPVQQMFGTPDTAFEFQTTSLADLTALGTPTTEDADTTVPDHYYCAQAAAAAVGWEGRYVAVSTPFTAIAKLTAWVERLTFNSAALFFGEATPGALDTFGPRMTSDGQAQIAHVTWTSPTGTGTNVTLVAAGGAYVSPVYLAIKAASSDDVDTLVSWSGYLFSTVTTTGNPTFTLGSVGLVVESEDAAQPAAGAFDYLRIWNSALTFPGAP